MDMPPQNPAAFPPPPTGVPGQPGYFPPKVRFDTIGEAWKLLQQQMGVWVGAMLIYLGVTAGIYLVGWLVLLPIFLIVAPHGDAGGALAFIGMMGSFLMMMVIVIAASSVMLAGLYRMAVRQVRGETLVIGDLFGAVDMAGPALIATLLMGLASMVGAMFCIIPAYIVHGMLMLTLPIMADRRLGPVDAMKASYEALKSDMLMATLYAVVLGLVASLGVIACGFGVVVTMPLLFLGTALVYRDFFIVPTAVPVLDTPAPVPPASIVPDQPSAVYPSPAPTIVPEVAPEQPGHS